MNNSQFVPRLRQLLPLDDAELLQVLEYSASLPPDAATQHLTEMLGDSPQAMTFVQDFNSRNNFTDDVKKTTAPTDTNGSPALAASSSPAVPVDSKPSQSLDNHKAQQVNGSGSKNMPYAAPPGAPPPSFSHRQHMNQVTRAAALRAQDEQDIQQHLQTLQFRHHIYNSDIEPEHETEYYCQCDIHQYKARKYARYGVQDIWSKAVMYPGEKAYTDRATINNNGGAYLFSSNPYLQGVTSPYGYNQSWRNPWGPSRPVPAYYTSSIMQTIQLNNRLNAEAQRDIDAREPRHNIWTDDPLAEALGQLSVGEKPKQTEPDKKSKLTSFRQSLGIKNSEERAVSRTTKSVNAGADLRDQIVAEENGRWPDEGWRLIVMAYQQHVGMAGHIRELRARRPTQYLHLLRAGYFEPIPVAWATQASNPLKFSIEAAAGWRGLTPAWRGYEDTAEERLYWVLNHREGSVGQRLKPDFISEMRMANERMARAVEPPPAYYSNDDTCRVQHTSAGYSKQVLPPPFRPVDAPESPTDDTMILLDISGSMDFDPQRPVYQEYLITGYTHSTQPKNKDVAKAIVRRFTDAMAHHDHQLAGYDLVTFSSQAHFMGAVHHQNLNQVWSGIRFGGGTRVMTGWQQVKERHFQKHSESATYHPVYGWQAGPQTPILRLLLLLDGEATDMDEFELDLLGSSWAHVTIFLIGVDGCPHHHRHANELQRISDVNHHVSFVDAQGNFPERYVTHELLKRHLGYDVSMQEFQAMEELPAYSQF